MDSLESLGFFDAHIETSSNNETNYNTTSETSTATAFEYYDHELSSLTDQQEKAITILPLITGLISIIGSTTIIMMAYQTRRARKWSTYTRLLVVMSLWDIVFSGSFAMTAFLLPAESSQRVWAFGTDKTCSAMGFLLQLSSSGIFYNGMLSFYFLLAAKFGITKRIMGRYIEPIMHIVSIGYPLITSSIGLEWGVYHETELGQTCWVANYPENCGEAPGESGEPCQSTMLGYVFGAVVVGFTFLALLFNNLAMLLFVRKQLMLPSIGTSSSSVDEGNRSTCMSHYQTHWRRLKWILPCGYHYSKKTSTHSVISSRADPKDRLPRGIKEFSAGEFDESGKRTITTKATTPSCEQEDFLDENDLDDDGGNIEDNEHNYEGNNYPEEVQTMIQQKHLERLQMVASQSYLYVAAFMLSSIWPTMIRILESLNYNKIDEDKLYVLLVCQSIFFPLQGVLNLLVYSRPRYIKNRTEFPDESKWFAFRRAILGDDKVQPAKPIEQEPPKDDDEQQGHEQQHQVRGEDPETGLPQHQPRLHDSTDDRYDIKNNMIFCQPRFDLNDEKEIVNNPFFCAGKGGQFQEKYDEKASLRRNAPRIPSQHHYSKRLARAIVSSLTASHADDLGDFDDCDCPAVQHRKPVGSTNPKRGGTSIDTTAIGRRLPEGGHTVSSLTASIGDFSVNEGPEQPISAKQSAPSPPRWATSWATTNSVTQFSDKKSPKRRNSISSILRKPGSSSSSSCDDIASMASSMKRVRFHRDVLIASLPNRNDLPRFCMGSIADHDNVDLTFDRMEAISGCSNHSSVYKSRTITLIKPERHSSSSLPKADEEFENDHTMNRLVQCKNGCPDEQALVKPVRKPSWLTNHASNYHNAVQIIAATSPEQPPAMESSNSNHSNSTAPPMLPTRRLSLRSMLESEVKENEGDDGRSQASFAASEEAEGIPRLEAASAPSRSSNDVTPMSQKLQSSQLELSTTENHSSASQGVLHIHGETIYPGYLPKDICLDAPLQMPSRKRSLTAMGA